MAFRHGKRHSKLNRIVIVLVAVAVAFFGVSSYLDKAGQDMGEALSSLELPNLTAFVEWLADISTGEFFDFDTANSEAAPTASGEVSQAEPPLSLSDARLEVHYLDMGQADSILIRGPEKNVLIDAGENNQGEQVLRYLHHLEISRIDILIGTHPHSDHIGGLDTVIESIDAGEIILPVIPEAITPTTVTYTDLLMAIAKTGLTLTPASPGDQYDLGDGAVLTILGPVEDYTDLNNMSVVSRLDYGDASFLFTGDMESVAEQDLLSSGQRLSAVVMDAGHHGSSTSSSAGFIAAVSPQVVVISCGLDNSYGHPKREVVERFQELGAQILRTDLDGAVVLRTDGTALEITTENQ